MKQRERNRENEEAVEKFLSYRSSTNVLNEDSSMEKVVRVLIDRMHIRNVSWVKINNGNSFQVTFTIENGVRCDDAIHHLRSEFYFFKFIHIPFKFLILSEWGIGQREGSSVVIVPCAVYRDHRHYTAKNEGGDQESTATSNQSLIKETSWNKFIGTVRARMNVAKIVDAVRADATLTFDFIVLLIVAGILAAFGLVGNSTLFLAASMLISPLMGPILAATFGTAIKDFKLRNWGLKNEAIGILLCITVGFIFGVVNCCLDYLIGKDDEFIQLTFEMENRMTFHSLIVGIMIALPSGAAVAIAVLGENFGSLVGVAISASLLPPSVNTGLGWSYSLVNFAFRKFESFERFHSFFREGYEKKYSNDEAIELLFLGLISLGVTLTNVISVYLMAILFLKLKEVAPVAENQRQFWRHDIKIARDYNKTLTNTEEGNRVRTELAEFNENAVDNFKGVGAELLRLHNPYHSTQTWSPFTHVNRHIHRDTYKTGTSVKNLEQLFKSMDTKHHRQAETNRNTSSPEKRHSTNTMFTPSRSSNDYLKMCSAPLEVISEVPKVLQIDSRVGFDDPSPCTSNHTKKKFIVTPARD